MLNVFLDVMGNDALKFIGIAIAFLATWAALAKGKQYLPGDHGREFAHDGALSEGKPRGAGLIFVSVFTLVAIIFGKLSLEHCIYLVLIYASMLTGYLDDRSAISWGEVKKGVLDLVISIAATITYIVFNGTAVTFALVGTTITLHPALFGLLAIILFWASINVTNCADGVDALSATLSIVTLTTIFFIMEKRDVATDYSYLIVIFMATLLAYLWFNATPSILMMGDAGSRAMGFFIALGILKTGCPFLYLLVAIVLILDGGLGLIKITIIRVFKRNPMKNLRTPLHDHVRKNMGWSNAQTVYRFAIIQIAICAAVIYLI